MVRRRLTKQGVQLTGAAHIACGTHARASFWMLDLL